MKRLPIIAALGAILLSAGGVIAWASFSEGAQAQRSASGADRRSLQALLQTDGLAPTISRGTHDLTIVVFSDYQCPYCRKLHHELEAIIGSDPKIKLMFRDWPVFGSASTEAAKAAIASQWQNKYAAFNDALMRAPGKLSSETIRRAANHAGVDWARLQRDLHSRKAEIDALLDRNSRYAAALGLQGTPGILVGPYFIPGGVGRDQLAEIVAVVRKARTLNAPS